MHQSLREFVLAALCLFAVLCGRAGEAASANSLAAATVTPLAITVEERAWLQAHPVIRVGCDPDFRPFCFRGPDGTIRGIDVDLLTALGKRLGVRFEFQTGETWSEIYGRAVRREVDLLSSTADIPERRAAFTFTRGYARFPVTIVVRSDGPFAVTRADLREMRVAGARDYAPTVAFRRNYPGITLEEVDSMERALVRVAEGNADAVVTNLANASYLIKARGLTNLKIAGVLPEMFEQRLAVRIDWPELHAILEKSLATLTPDELATILDRWVKVDYAAVIRWDVVRRWAAVGAVFALTVIGLVMWRNRSLKRELEKRRAVQQALEAANVRLNQANTDLAARHEEKSELMRMAAHDLRNPLTVILLSTDPTMPCESEGRTNELARVRSAAGQMRQLIDDLLEVHALEEGRREFRFEALDANTLLQTSLATLGPVAQRKNIGLDGSGLRDVPAVRADAGALRQVFDNLISNALKFSPAGRRVAVHTTVWNGFVRVEVHDEGPGVAAAERERIFTKYARGEAKPTGGEKSTGLGLAIVRDLVAVMNGRVWCEASAAGGAVFVVALPRADAGTQPNGATDTRS